MTSPWTETAQCITHLRDKNIKHQHEYMYVYSKVTQYVSQISIPDASKKWNHAYTHMTYFLLVHTGNTNNTKSLTIISNVEKIFLLDIWYN